MHGAKNCSHLKKATIHGIKHISKLYYSPLIPRFNTLPDASCQRSPQPSTLRAQPNAWGVRGAVPTKSAASGVGSSGQNRACLRPEPVRGRNTLATSNGATMADAVFDPIEQDEKAWADLFCSQPGVLALPHQSRQKLATRANVDARDVPDRGADKSERDRRQSELAMARPQACGAKRGAPQRPLSGGSSSAERHIRARMQLHRRRLIGKRASQKPH